MQQLPEDINQAIGLLIKVRDDASADTFNNFGTEPYYFDLKPKDDLQLTDDQRIKLHPVKDNMIVLDRVHILAIMMGYKAIREEFQVVGNGFDTDGTIQDY